MTDIEDTIFELILPVNTIAIIGRLRDLLKEHDTNSLCNNDLLEDRRFDKILLLLMMQRYQVLPDLNKLYTELRNLQRRCTV